jgi:hypothetical protein
MILRDKGALPVKRPILVGRGNLRVANGLLDDVVGPAKLRDAETGEKPEQRRKAGEAAGGRRSGSRPCLGHVVGLV